jgi:signal transduction histidine kinase
VLVFAASGLVALVVLAVLATVAVRRVAAAEAVENARALAELTGSRIVEPELTPGVADRDPTALARLDIVVRERALGDTVVHVRLWAPDGRIVYADQRRLIGGRYPLGDDERRVLREGGVDSRDTDLSRPENRLVRRDSRLIEVFLPVRTQDGRPLLYEQYVLHSAVAADRRALYRELALPLLAALVLLWAVQLPLAASLARRLQREQERREALLVRAAEASQEERRRIAADLHDRVVQDLAGIAFRLEAAAQRVPAGSPELADTVRQSAAGTRASMRRLRSLLVEIYPPRLREAGLEAALADTLSPAAFRSVETTLDVAPDLDLDADVEALVFRTAQEAVRNALAHAHAAHIGVTVGRSNGRVRLVVADDGRGFGGEEADSRRREGHLGLSLLADLASSAGGTLAVDSLPGSGTRVTLEVPAA